MKTTRSVTSTPRRRQPPLQVREPGLEQHVPEDVRTNEDPPRYETFTVRFLLDAEGRCRRTDVSSVQQGNADAWAGYDAQRLMQWIAEHVGPSISGISPATDAEAQKPDSVIQQIDQPPSNIQFSLSDLEVVPLGAGAFFLVEANRRVAVRFTIEAVGVAQAAIDCIACLYVRQLGHAPQSVGESQCTLMSGTKTVVEVATTIPEPGLYRVSVGAALALPGAAYTILDGMLLHVYDSGEPS